MAQKPANLIYGVHEEPPLWATLLLGIQHVFVITVYFIFPVIIVNSIGGSEEQAATMVKMSMVVIGITTILQAIKKGPVGSGYLCPSGNGPAYLSAQLLAAKTGGLSLVCGMALIGGIFEALFSRVVARLRVLFPPEVAGLVVTMVGIELIPYGIKRFLGVDHSSFTINRNELIVAVVTYASMLGFSIWSKGKLRLYPMLIGLAIGYLLSYLFGILTASNLRQITQSPFISFPKFASFGWSFDMALLLPFIIATLCSSLKDIGDITTCQKINDSEWKRCDMESISRGILADSLGDIISGLIGGLSQTTSSSNIGLSLGTGATSRRIAYAIGATLCLLAFFPKLAAIFVIMPKPVMGAILVFVANFMILAGIQIITTRMIDTRKIFVIGTSFIFGLSVHFFPDAYNNLPQLLRPIFSPAMSFATILVVVLNLVFRIGISKHQVLSLEPQITSLEKISSFMETQGAAWGARREVIQFAMAAMSEFMESLVGLRLAEGEIVVKVSFDEMRLDVVFDYDGKLMDFNALPVAGTDILEDEEAIARMSGFLIRHYVDRIKTEQKDTRCRVLFHFDH